MSERNRYIILMGILVGAISSLYFFSLLLPVPFLLTVSIVVVAFALLFMWIVPERSAVGDIPVYSTRKEWIGIVILTYGILWLSIAVPDRANTYGEWDAYSIWNLHARYLVDPLHWQKLFQDVEYSHPDYPLCLPATLAFFLRLTSSPDSLIIPFIFHMFIALCIPVLIYGELWRRNAVVATVVLSLFPVEVFYIFQSTTQYADVLLSFFFLCALVCIRYSDQNKKYLILSVLFLGCCAWTKNEGFVLAAVLLAVYARRLFSKKTIKYTLLAMVVPIMVIATFKVICPVRNDLVAESGPNMLTYLLKTERYTTIFNYFIQTASTKFLCVRLSIAVYLIICLVKRHWPGREFVLVATCLFAYFMIYLFTPKDLTWHLYTSCERLFIQLFPVFLFAMGLDLASMKWGFPGIMQSNATKKEPVAAAPKITQRSAMRKNKHS